MKNSTVFRAVSVTLLAATTALGISACGASADPTSSAQGKLEGAPDLGTTRRFAVLGSSTVTNTGATSIRGDLGVSPGLAITGFPPGIIVEGVAHAGDAVALQAQTDATAAYDSLSGRACTADLSGQDLGGLTLVPGVYCFSSAAQLTGALVLDAGGRSDAVFIFKIGSTLTTASAASVRVIRGGTGCNVFWRVGSSATLGTGTTFSGSLFALASVTLSTNAKVDGRTVARTGAVTMDTNAVSLPVCSSAPDGGASDSALSDSQVLVTDTATQPSDSATTPDSSPIDAGTPPADASTTPDSSSNDAGTPPADAGSAPDSGSDEDASR